MYLSVPLPVPIPFVQIAATGHSNPRVKSVEHKGLQRRGAQWANLQRHLLHMRGRECSKVPNTLLLHFM